MITFSRVRRLLITLLLTMPWLSQTSAHAAHYKVFLLGGQSNMFGNGTKPNLLPAQLQAPQDDVLIYYGTNFTTLRPGSGSSFGPELSFGRTLADARPHENFYFIKHAQGGTSLWAQWNPSNGGTYSAFRTIVDFGLDAMTRRGDTYEIVGMLWTQGERDALNSRTTAQYEADLNAFIADIRNRYGADLPFFLSRLSVLQTGRDISEVRPAQENVAAADPNSYLIDTDSMGMMGDAIHFSEAGQVSLGEAFAQAYLSSLPTDGSAPGIDTLSPSHTAPAVELTANLSITFNEDIALGSGNITLRQAGGALVESFDVATPSTHLTLSGATITIDPTNLLAASTGYYIEIDATAIDDHAGNSFAGISGEGTWSFTTSAADITLPGISSLSPANGASNVRFNSDLTIAFTENVAFGSGNITLRQTGGTLVESYDVTNPSGNLTLSGDTLVINPTNDLLPSVGYYVEFDATAIDDHAGNSFAGISGDTDWSFTATVSLVGDAQIIATASYNTDFSWHPYRSFDGTGLTGSEHSTAQYAGWATSFVDPSSAWIQWDLGASYTLSSIRAWNLSQQGDNNSSIRSVDIYYSNDLNSSGVGADSWTRLGTGPVEFPQAPATGTPNVGFDLATVVGTPLPATEVRFIRFDLKTNWFGNSYRTGLAEIQFFAGPIGPDIFAPGVSSFSPANSAVEVDPTSNLVVTFNEDVAFGSGNITLKQSGGAVVETFKVVPPSAGLGLTGDTVTINPAADLSPLTTYYLEIDGTAVEDLSGNPFSGFSGEGSWSFTTVTPDMTKPAIALLNPTNGQNFFIPTGNLEITFNEEVAFGSGSINLRRSDGSVVESFDVATPPSGLTLSGTTVTIDPGSALALSTTYYVEIPATAIDDLAGNSFDGFTGNGTWSFTTAATLQVGTVDASGFYDVTNKAVVTTDLLDWGYVSRQANNNKSGGFGSISEVNANNVAFGSLTLGGYGNLTTVSGSSSIGTVSFTEGAPSDVLAAAFTGSGGGWYSFNGNAAHGDMRGMNGNEQDVWKLTFNDLGVGKFEITLYLGVSKSTANRIFDMDFSLNDGNTISGTSTSATANTYTLYEAPAVAEDCHLFTYKIAVTTTTAGADLSLTFGGVSGDNGGEVLLSGYTVAAVAPGNTFTDWIGSYTGLNGLTAFNDDADGDGKDNGLENYFGTHPGEFSQGLVSGVVSGNTMTFTHPLNDTPASNLTASYRWSKDLSGFHGDGGEFEGTTVSFNQSALTDGIVTVTATVTGSALERLFVDIEVTEN